MSIATEVDVLVRRQRRGTKGPQPRAGGPASAQVDRYCQRGRDLHALAVSTAFRRAGAAIAAGMFAAGGASRRP